MDLATIRIIDHRLHGLLDMLVDVSLTGLALVAWYYDLSAAAIALPFVIGLCNLVYSGFTRYALGRQHLISFPTHLVLDAVAGVALIAGAGVLADAVPYRASLFAMGVGILGAVALTNPEVPSDSVS